MLVSIFHWVAIHSDTTDGLGRLSHDCQWKTHFFFRLPPGACLCNTLQPSSFLLQAQIMRLIFACNPTLLSNTHHPSSFLLQAYHEIDFFACNPTLLILHSPGRRMDKDLATFFFCFMKLFSEAPLIVKSYKNTIFFPGHGAVVCEPNTDQW